MTTALGYGDLLFPASAQEGGDLHGSQDSGAVAGPRRDFRRGLRRLDALGPVTPAERAGDSAAPPPRQQLLATGRTASVGRVNIDPRVDIGHVHLKVSDIDRSLAFYRDILGFDVMQRM